MSIPVSCERCFQSFRVKDEFAGRTIRCKECGAAMAVPWDAVEPDDDIVASRPRVRKRKKRPSAAPKIAAIVVGCVFGVVVLGTGVWFAVRTLSQRREAGNDAQTDAGSKQSRLGGTRFRIIDTDADWKPDPSLLQQLGQRATVGSYELRLPGPARLVKSRRIAENDCSNLWGVGLEKSETISVVIVPNTATDYESEFKEAIPDLDNLSVPSPFGVLKTRLQRIERGRLNGRSSHRVVQQWCRPESGEPLIYSLSYDFADGKNSVLVSLSTQAAPGSAKYKLLENALLSIHRR